MPGIRRSLVWLAASVLAACTAAGQSPPPDGGSATTPSDRLDCRAEARRQADQMYPSNPQVAYDQGQQWSQSLDRSRVEDRFYEQCLQRKNLAPAGAK